MDFNLSEEQQMLVDSAERFVAKEYPFEKRRTIVNSDSDYSQENWQKMAEMGWLMLNVPEQYGGLESPFLDTCILLKSLGKGLLLEPFISTAVWSSLLISGCENKTVKDDTLESMVVGSLKVAVAHSENGQSINQQYLETKAEKTDNGYVINGHKMMVFDGPSADYFIASAMVGETFYTLFLVDKNMSGLKVESYQLIDGSVACDVFFNDCLVPESNVLAEGKEARDLYEKATDKAHLAALSDAVGLMDFCLDVVADYVKNRQQFGQAIGSFQSIQHIMAEMFVYTQESHSILYYGLSKINDESDSERKKAISAAKIVIVNALKYVTEQGIQLHGGYGVTDEYVMSHLYKRGLVRQQFFGDSDAHVRRFTEI